MSWRTVLVLGGGAFGTSISSVLANNFERVVLKVRSNDVYQDLLQGQNDIYLKDKKLPDNILPAMSWSEVHDKVVGEIDLIVSGLPTTAINSFLYDNYRELEEILKREVPLVSLSKGIDPVTLELPDDLFFNYFSQFADNFTFLSGPSFAHEILDEQITLVSLAGRYKKNLEVVSQMLGTSYFKVLTSYDIKGTLLGGALKNILAIAGGIIEGMGFNYNTRAAMITRGIAEMLRFGRVYNARPETFYGLSGMGDLILTTTGDLSRNKQFGLKIASGRKAKEIIESERYVVEGYRTAKAVHRISDKHDIRAQIFNGVYDVLYDDQNPHDVIKRIMATPSKFEN